MEPHCISFREIPHSTRLFLDFLYDFSRVARFYAFDAFAADSFARAAERVPADRMMRSAVAEVLAEQNRAYGAGPKTQENIERLRTGTAFAVVTGQQIGLFTGPSYTIYKAITALRLAEQLTAAGIPAVPLFWMAAEDHDFAEVNHCAVLDRRHQLHKWEHPAHSARPMQVGEILLGDEITRIRQELCAVWEHSPEAAELNALVRAYQPGVSYADAFARTLQRLLRETGLVVVNPLDARLLALAAPLFRQALEQAETLQQRLAERNRALERAGYHRQVRLRESATLLFVNVEGERRALRRQRNGFQVANHGLLGQAELRELLHLHPERFSPNVLLRPLTQDTLFPTVAYVAGPAEIAYFAQASALYDALLGRMPVIVPRVSFTLVDRGLQRLLERYQLAFSEVFQPRNAIYMRMAQSRLPHSLRRRLTANEARLAQMLAQLEPGIARLDPTLQGAVGTARRKMLYQFQKLSAKVARSHAGREEIVERHLARLTTALYPERDLQERTINIFSFLAHYGMGLTPRLAERVRFPCRDHQVVYLDG